jgi:hypothetical protein
MLGHRPSVLAQAPGALLLLRLPLRLEPSHQADHWTRHLRHATLPIRNGHAVDTELASHLGLSQLKAPAKPPKAVWIHEVQCSDCYVINPSTILPEVSGRSGGDYRG